MYPNKTQLLHLELVRNASFNDFDGEQVVTSLLDAPALWRSAYMTSDDGFILRDLPDDIWHVDTLYVLAAKGHEDALEALARTWNADEVDWLPDAGDFLRSWNQETRGNKRMILRVWWD